MEESRALKTDSVTQKKPVIVKLCDMTVLKWSPQTRYMTHVLAGSPVVEMLTNLRLLSFVRLVGTEDSGKP